MKSIDQYIKESILDDDDEIQNKKTVQPTTKEDLTKIIEDTIHKEGWECDLNFIDTSKITDMSYLFCGYRDFNGDISEWDVSNVKNMQYMFMRAESFNQPIGNWNMYNVTNIRLMFDSAKSFNQDISNWDLSNVSHIVNYMLFSGCPIKDEYKPKFK